MRTQPLSLLRKARYARMPFRSGSRRSIRRHHASWRSIIPESDFSAFVGQPQQTRKNSRRDARPRHAPCRGKSCSPRNNQQPNHCIRKDCYAQTVSEAAHFTGIIPVARHVRHNGIQVLRARMGRKICRMECAAGNRLHLRNSVSHRDSCVPDFIVRGRQKENEEKQTPGGLMPAQRKSAGTQIRPPSLTPRASYLSPP